MTQQLLRYAFIQNAQLITQADGTAIVNALRQADVQVNPRFGTFSADAASLGIKDANPDWIQAAPTPKAS